MTSSRDVALGDAAQNRNQTSIGVWRFFEPRLINKIGVWKIRSPDRFPSGSHLVTPMRVKQ